MIHLDDLDHDLEKASRALIAIMALVPADVARQSSLEEDYRELAEALYCARNTVSSMRDRN